MRIKADIGRAAREAPWCPEMWQAEWSLVQRRRMGDRSRGLQSANPAVYQFHFFVGDRTDNHLTAEIYLRARPPKGRTKVKGTARLDKWLTSPDPATKSG
jgi:hypothetical protein